jgi:hypothetical protein
MKYQSLTREFKSGGSIVAFEPETNCSKNRLKNTSIEFIRSITGTPDYSFTLTIKPVSGPRRCFTKINDAEQAMNWFLHVLNTKCFGHGHRRKKLELGVYATLEGLGVAQQPHWHGAFRLPRKFPHEKFLSAFVKAKARTKRFGGQCRLEPYYEGRWYEYTVKTGVDSIAPQFLRRGTP